MNRFRSRKKSVGDKTPDGSRRPSLENEVPPLPSFSSKAFRRKKQAAPEAKPEIDLTSALPASDDFRTSLLMPNLSARFSMLREQDDPKSKIGKANDDSVLFPKRASRLDLFNRQGLSNIAESDSVHGPIRPPFAQSRTESYGSGGYDIDEGSMISRSRPGEGNTMFGGRQKIYKIPVGGSGSVKNFNAEEGEAKTKENMGGKALYESDIATSAFQKLREEERRQERDRLDNHATRSSKEQERSGSPPLAKYNRNRETSSSTNSGPSQPRTSTAATSVASQKSVYGAQEAINGSPVQLPQNAQSIPAGSDRPLGKGRRLYGQGLDQHMHEQQSSALHRLESIQRSRTPVGGSLLKNAPQSRSATNLNDRYQRGGPLYTSNGFRAGSPPPSATPPRMQEFDLGLNSDESLDNGHVDSGYGRSPPFSPPMSPGLDLNQDATFVAALEPNDLGKATASGAFNKPRKQYNEQQYLQRQLALQEGRGTPSPQLIRPFSPQASSFDEQASGRSRNNSLGSNFSRTNSMRQPWEYHMEDRVLRAVPESGNSPAARRYENHVDSPNDQSFLNGLSGSEVGSESDADPNSPIPSQSGFNDFSHPTSQLQPVELKGQLNFDPDSTHLQSPSEENNSDSRSYRSGTTITQQRNDSAPDGSNEPNMEDDSPTLGPVGVPNGLSGLVHQHLRNDSGTSSIYPDESPEINKHNTEVRNSIFGHASALNHSRQQSRETNGDDWAKDGHLSDHSSVVEPPPLQFAARHILEQAQALRNNQDNAKAQQMLGNNKAQRILGGEAPRSSHSRNTSVPWQEQLKAHHARVGSTETQQEREDLAEELAQRRRAVQDNLKNYVQVEERTSPESRTQGSSPVKPSPPFGILKKGSKGTLVEKQERPSKAMKMLGISPDRGRGPSVSPNPSHRQPDTFAGRDQLSDRAMPPMQRLAPHPMNRSQDVRQHSDTPPTSRQREPGSLRSQENLAQKPSPRSSKSGSSHSDRSDRRSPESRKGSAVKATMEREARANGYTPNGAGPASAINNQFSIDAPRPIHQSMARHGGLPTERSQSAMSNRIRSGSNSKTAHPEPRVAPPNTPFMVNPSKSRPQNPYSYSTSSAPSLSDSRPSMSSTTPNMLPSQKSPTHRTFNHHFNSRKGSINKHEISEPRFVSSTSSVDTVNLPENASLRNGMDSPPYQNGSMNAPPIPARDSRRKRTHTLLQAFGRVEKPEPSPTFYTPQSRSSEPDPYEERSTFSADDEPAPVSSTSATRAAMRQRLRKTSSEGGSMAQKARAQALNAPSPAVPNVELQSPVADHVPYQAQKDVPASAVMF